MKPTKASNGFISANGGPPLPTSAAGKMMGGRGSGSGCSRNRTQEFFSAVGSLENTYVTHRQPLLQNGATNKHGQLAKRYHQNFCSHDLCQNQSVEASVLWVIRYSWNRCYTIFMVWPNPLLADFVTYHISESCTM